MNAVRLKDYAIKEKKKKRKQRLNGSVLRCPTYLNGLQGADRGGPPIQDTGATHSSI